MAITLRNKALEAKIKEIGRRTGLGPSAVIARAIDRETAELEERRTSLVAKRTAAEKELRAMLPDLTDADRAAIDQAMEDLYDEHGLPK